MIGDSAFTEGHVRGLCDQLGAAGDDWQAAAEGMPDITAANPGNAAYRDRCELRKPWSRIINNGRDIIECRPTLVRDEDGQWSPLGWSNASEGRIIRPMPGHDGDAD